MQLLRQAHLISTQRNIKFVAISLRYCITSSALNTMKRTLYQNSLISFLFFYFPLRKLLFFFVQHKGNFPHIYFNAIEGKITGHVIWYCAQ